MNGFLLFYCCNLDDVPVRLYPTFEGARRAAKRRNAPTINPLGTWDSSGFICWKILEFRGGVPRDQATIIFNKGTFNKGPHEDSRSTRRRRRRA
jgi:hypothetical protein